MLHSNTEDSCQLLVVGGEMAKGLAVHLAGEWHVRLLSDDESLVRATDSARFDAVAVEFEAGELERHACDADTALVVTDCDRTGLLVTQLLDTVCEIEHILTRVDDSRNRGAFEAIDCDLIETAPLLQPAVEQKLSAGG